MRYFKLLLVSAFLLTAQTASLEHLIDHQLAGHEEWCQAFDKADLQTPVSSVAAIPNAYIDFEYKGTLVQVVDYVPNPSPYSPRAPPAV